MTRLLRHLQGKVQGISTFIEMFSEVKGGFFFPSVPSWSSLSWLALPTLEGQPEAAMDAGVGAGAKMGAPHRSVSRKKSHLSHHPPHLITSFKPPRLRRKRLFVEFAFHSSNNIKMD